MHRSECTDHGRAGDKDGYASTCAHEYQPQRNKLKLHRLVYCRHNSVDINSLDGFVILHSCDNPRCINPNHLSKGTVKDNALDRVAKNRFCGTTAIMAKLDADAIKFIRANYVKRGKVWNTRTLAVKYGVCHQTISNVLLNKQYKELDDA